MSGSIPFDIASRRKIDRDSGPQLDECRRRVKTNAIRVELMARDRNPIGERSKCGFYLTYAKVKVEQSERSREKQSRADEGAPPFIQSDIHNR